MLELNSDSDQIIYILLYVCGFIMTILFIFELASSESNISANEKRDWIGLEIGNEEK